METKDILGLVISGLTLLVVAYYTWETHKMQKAVTKQVKASAKQTEAAQKQTAVAQMQLETMTQQTKIGQTQSEELTHQIRLSIMPAFLTEIARIRKDQSQPESEVIGDYGDRIHITNIGYGPAVKIEIDPVYIHEKDAVDHPLNIAFERLTVLRPGERYPINHISREGEVKTHVDFFANLQEKYAGGRVYQLNIRFQDIEGSQYTQKVEMGKGGCKLGPVTLVSEEHQGVSNGV